MSKFRKKPIIIEASQWIRQSDHPSVAPNLPHKGVCDVCRANLSRHGVVETLEGHHIVCPGDWIITGIQGEVYPCKPDIFEATYAPVEEDNDE